MGGCCRATAYLVDQLDGVELIDDGNQIIARQRGGGGMVVLPSRGCKFRRRSDILIRAEISMAHHTSE
jgi:hypothetical protein